MQKLKKSPHKNELVLALVFLLMFVVFSIISDHFLTLTNTMSLLSQMVELGLLTLAMSASMISGGMDLSISATCSLSTVFLGIFIGKAGLSSPLAVLVFSYLIAGRRIYLIGASPEVARFAGINLRKNLFLTYMFCAAMAFLASLVFASKISAGRADVADSLLLKTVSASVFGGVSTLGGIGTLGGAMLGVAVITLISNGLDMINASSYLQQVVIGAMLLIVLAYRHARKK